MPPRSPRKSASLAAADAPRPASIGLILTDDAELAELNEKHMGYEGPTDVLSFAASSPPAGHPSVNGAATRRTRASHALPFLGDIVIATGVARRQAREQGHAYRTELRVLALHGLLHLLGYDHDDPGDRGAMSRVEARLRRKGGLKEGLIGRISA